MDHQRTRGWIAAAALGLPLGLTAIVTACSSSTSAAGHDAGVVDATHADTSQHHDAGSPKPDTGGETHDAGKSSEAGHPDAAVDAAPPDTGRPWDATDPSCTGIPYCDGFETYAAGLVTNGAALGPWAATVQHAVVSVDSVNAYSGKQSLHITVAYVPDGGGAQGILQQKQTSGLVTGNDLFGRAMLYYSDADGNGLPLNVHSWFFEAEGTSTADDGGVSLNLGGGGAKLQLNYHPPPPATEQSVQGGMVTAGTWHCVQWQYDGAGNPTADLANVWIDGTPAVGVDAGKGWKFATPWNIFQFGFTHYQNLSNPIDVYLDDFAMGPVKIGCPG